MAIAEIAFLLGFSEANAFHRAFKPWCGRTPADLRRSVAQPAGTRRLGREALPGEEHSRPRVLFLSGGSHS
jgi:AraC-like DNA-binding protein